VDYENLVVPVLEGARARYKKGLACPNLPLGFLFLLLDICPAMHENHKLLPTPTKTDLIDHFQKIIKS
jgi:hypothetical protein